MPKETFLKLSNEKQQKVINSAKKEFARVPIQEVSIKNIVEDAGIARGSFYQYFESKEDLLIYIIKENVEELNNKLSEEIQKKNGNLFEKLNTFVNTFSLNVLANLAPTLADNIIIVIPHAILTAAKPNIFRPVIII